MWLARDEDGTLVLATEKLIKAKNEWVLPEEMIYDSNTDYFIELPTYFRELFPEIKWENEEATPVKIVLEL